MIENEVGRGTEEMGELESGRGYISWGLLEIGRSKEIESLVFCPLKPLFVFLIVLILLCFDIVRNVCVRHMGDCTDR